MDVMELFTKMIDRLESKVDRIDEKVDAVSLDVNNVKNDVATLQDRIEAHADDEKRLTKKAALIISGVIAIVATLGFGSIIVFAPKVIVALAPLVGG